MFDAFFVLLTALLPLLLIGAVVSVVVRLALRHDHRAHER